MFIEVYKNNGYKHLRIVKSVYRPNGKGCSKITVKSLGALSKYDDGQPDFVKRLKESFKNGHPIIPGIEQYCNQNYKEPEGSGTCVIPVKSDKPVQREAKHFSHALIESYLQEIGLIRYLSLYKSTEDVSFDVVGFFRMLVYGRILSPASKIATTQQNASYYNPIISSGFNEYDVYDTLDFVERHGEGIINKMNGSLTAKFNRTAGYVFYDCTNFFFETDRPDADRLGAGGEEIPGIRKKGFSKEHRTSPIVQMGLFTDEQGVPISIEMFPGNTLDCKTVCGSLKGIKGLSPERFVFVGDRGMYSEENKAQLLGDGNGYIISRSIAKSPRSEKAWILDEEGYVYEGRDFKHKSRIVSRTVTGEDGIAREVKEKVVVYWSAKYEKQQYAENRRTLETADSLKDSPEKSPYVPEQAKAVRKFLKKEYTNAKTGEIIKASDLRAMVDSEAVDTFRKTLGYYQIVTSELEMPDLEVIDKYHGLSRIEEQFRIMKSTLDARPIFVRKPEHIYAHLLICMISLVVIRLIQNRIVQHQGKPPAKNWSSGLSADRVQNALNGWKVVPIDEKYYMMLGDTNPDLQLIFDTFGIEHTQNLYTKKELLGLKTSIKVI